MSQNRNSSVWVLPYGGVFLRKPNKTLPESSRSRKCRKGIGIIFGSLLTNSSVSAIIPINQLVQLVFKERSTVWHEKRLSGTSQTQLPLWTNALLPGCEDGWVLCCAPGLLRKPLAISCPGVGSPARAFLFSARNKKERGTCSSLRFLQKAPPAAGSPQSTAVPPE